MPVPSVPEDFEQIYIPARILRDMEELDLPVREVTETIHCPDRVSHSDQPGRWVAERAAESGDTIQVVYGVRSRPEQWDEEWAEIEAERAVEVVVHTSDPSSPDIVELKTAIVVRLVTRTAPAE
jgi:hypothetical protein